MSGKRSILVLHLLLVFLLAGDLGYHIFVDATTIDCNYGWTAAEPSPEGTVPYSCSTTDDKTYRCSKCGRDDHRLPSARNCVSDATGKVMNKGGLWACDVVLDVFSDSRKDGRQLICNQSASTDTYYCKSRNWPQQCRKESC
ncbi:uncharacterized protein MELLADRAFT_123865 [Melampsora larici-populina 98AG31]|uniref:Secreted protein n=1 Tax=Melampsora larici-populina (strain 98AG31 / pathotype 3-4-7) TaxID=747676 RepID=F4RP67_MELLP|nr:uncharacterized protein MELLADRAFT_123865 [Melampsora larici-populina 98AG31]EGG05764.1 secreted protein [Melampsora larici-populina 98AG31]